jgi:hypothetical protein
MIFANCKRARAERIGAIVFPRPARRAASCDIELRAAALKIQNLQLATFNKTRRYEEQIAHALPRLYSQLSGR